MQNVRCKVHRCTLQCRSTIFGHLQWQMQDARCKCTNAQCIAAVLFLEQFICSLLHPETVYIPPWLTTESEFNLSSHASLLHLIIRKGHSSFVGLPRKEGIIIISPNPDTDFWLVLIWLVCYNTKVLLVLVYMNRIKRLQTQNNSVSNYSTSLIIIWWIYDLIYI